MSRRYADRRDAGRRLAAAVRERVDVDADPLVLGLPRGGVPVAAEVARALGAELDALVVRKIGLPGRAELALGAVAVGAEPVVNADVLAASGLDLDSVDRLARTELAECARREAVYRPGRPPVDVEGRAVVLVDDGLATGASMRAAVRVLQSLGPPAVVVVAVPVGPRGTVGQLVREVDDVVCLSTPMPFRAVGYAYDDFRPTSDEEVRELLVYPGGH